METWKLVHFVMLALPCLERHLRPGDQRWCATGSRLLEDEAPTIRASSCIKPHLKEGPPKEAGGTKVKKKQNSLELGLVRCLSEERNRLDGHNELSVLGRTSNRRAAVLLPCLAPPSVPSRLFPSGGRSATNPFQVLPISATVSCSSRRGPRGGSRRRGT